MCFQVVWQDSLLGCQLCASRALLVSFPPCSQLELRPGASVPGSPLLSHMPWRCRHGSSDEQGPVLSRHSEGICMATGVKTLCLQTCQNTRSC